jgi:Flp pilus assembly pilin Flp
LFALAGLTQVSFADLKSTLHREEGQGMTEYAVTLAFIILGAAAIGTGLWLAIDGKFSDLINLIG